MAHWIIEDKGFGGSWYECSECHARYCDLYSRVAGGVQCPKCMADMDLDANEYVDENKKTSTKLQKIADAMGKIQIPPIGISGFYSEAHVHEENVQKLEMLSGMKIDKLVELYAAGWTLKPPEIVMDISMVDILDIRRAEIEEEMRRAEYLNAGELVIPPLKINFKQLNNPPKETIKARDKFFEECDTLNVEEKDGVAVIEMEEPSNKKYKIEIWIHGGIEETFESDDINEVLKWYKSKWEWTYERGGCSFTLYEDDKELLFEQEYVFGFHG